MAVTVNIDRVKKTMSEQGLSLFTITDVTGKDLIAENQDVRYSPEQAIEMLCEAVAEIEDAAVLVTLHRMSKEDRKGGVNNRDKNFVFRLRNPNTAQGTAGIAGAGYPGTINGQIMSLMEKNQALQLEMIEERHKRAMDDMEKKISGTNPIVEQLLPHLGPIISALAGSLQGPRVAVNGHGETITEDAPAKTEKVPDETRRRVNIALRKIADTDTNYVETLEAIARLATEKPKMYHEFLPILKAQL